VFVISRRYINTKTMVAPEYLRWKLDQSGETPLIGSRKVGKVHAAIFLGHQQKIIRTHRPAALSILHKARLEVEERLIGLYSKRRSAAILAYFYRLDILVPVPLGTQNDPSIPCWVRNTKGPLQCCASCI